MEERERERERGLETLSDQKTLERECATQGRTVSRHLVSLQTAGPLADGLES